MKGSDLRVQGFGIQALNEDLSVQGLGLRV
jgi:hypothetical protein